MAASRSRRPIAANLLSSRVKYAARAGAKRSTLRIRPIPTTPMILFAKPSPLASGSSEFFCSNPACPFHVRVGDPGVHGFGDWATLADGTTVSHQWMEGELLCDLCAISKTRRH